MGNGDESQLTKADFTQKLSKKAYKQIKKRQMERLYELESECFDRGIPVMIVFEGWDAAGKGTAIRLLTERLDPRVQGAGNAGAPHPREAEALALAFLDGHPAPWPNGDFRPQLVWPGACGASRGPDAHPRLDPGL